MYDKPLLQLQNAAGVFCRSLWERFIAENIYQGKSISGQSRSSKKNAGQQDSALPAFTYSGFNYLQ